MLAIIKGYYISLKTNIKQARNPLNYMYFNYVPVIIIYYKSIRLINK
jgi:hypothetical protein